MLNVNDLERKHKIYKLKSFIPYIVIFVSLFVIFIVILFVNNSDIFKSNKAKHNQKTIESQIQEIKTTPIEVVEEKNETQVVPKEQQKIETKVEQSLVLAPSLNFISNIKHSSTSSEVSYQRVSNKEQKKIEQEKPKQERVLRAAKKEPEPVVIEEVKLQRSNPMKIQRQNTQEDISHVVQRFQKNNNPALSLFVAKKYYELEDYHQSYNYALITNRINDNIDASWIIFAKSLVKLGKKAEAMETLQKYINHSKSTQAKTLLEEIERGKFK